MKAKAATMKHAITLLTALLLLPLAATNADDRAKGLWRITNEVVAVTASARDAGAVCSLVYDGKEFVNDYDHGRQLQVAWIYNDQDEAYNPTEAGSGDDGTGPHSTSQLLSAQVAGGTLLTVSHPAYWKHPGPGKNGKNTALVTKDTLTKKITLGYNGDPHVMIFDTTLAISPELTGPPITALRIEAPTLYTGFDLSGHYLFDLTSGELTAVPSRAKHKDSMNERIYRVTRRELIPILSSSDGRHAVAFYTPQATNFWSYYTWDVPSDNPVSACMKITAFFQHAAEVGRTYEYRTFIIVGDLATVKACARRLPPDNTPKPAK
jgi:hypothetical protein